MRLSALRLPFLESGGKKTPHGSKNACAKNPSPFEEGGERSEPGGVAEHKCIPPRRFAPTLPKTGREKN